MPPKQAAKPKAKAEAPPLQPTEDELLAKLAEKELEAASARDRLQQLAAASEALGADNFSLTTEVDRHRATLKDINEYLTTEVRAKTARVASLEAQLADAQRDLEAGARKTQEEVDRAVLRYKTDLASKTVELASAQDRLKSYDTFLAEKDKLQVQLQSLLEDIDELKKAHHKKMMDLERKHAQDRELWKKDSAAAVKAAREEMMALTDNRLEITTKRTILENEQMSGELQYQSCQVQNLVQRNEALQRELSKLRVMLDVAKRGEEELVRKNYVCEKTIDTLLARLEAQDAERGGEGAAVVEYQQRVVGLEEEVHMVVVQLDERADLAARLGQELAEARKELEEVKCSHDGLAQFLAQCLEDAREQLAAGASGQPHSNGSEQPADPNAVPCKDALAALYKLALEQRERLLLQLLDHLHRGPDGAMPTPWRSTDGWISVA